MQIVSGNIHFKPPPSKQVHSAIKTFNNLVNKMERGGKPELSALGRTGFAHLYFERIHPFEDGNGRIGRVISENALSQSLRRPTFLTTSQIIEKSRNKNYFI
ncbi:MAG: Fic family protein [Bacteroidota bacterium]